MKNLLPCLAAATLLAGCNSADPQAVSEKTPTSPEVVGPATKASAATSGAAYTTAPATPGAKAETPQPAGPPVCSRSGEKAWGSGANKLTGLTTKPVDDGKVAVGYAIGVDPRVLVIDKATGAAKLHKVKTSEKAAPPPGKEGYRVLMRVTPAGLEGDTARAFIDYRDEYKDKRRRVACGPADSNEAFLSFEGTSYVDMDPKPTGEDKKKLFSWKKEGGYVELRDCRTFSSLKSNEMWALGSVLRGIEKPDGTNEWKMVLLVDFGPRDEEVVLHEAALKGDPPKLLAFEIPTARRQKDKGFVVATRFGGALMVGVLDPAKKLKGKFRTYKGFPTMPDISATDDTLMLMTGVGQGKEKSLKALLISRDTLELPAGYMDVALEPTDSGGDAEVSFTSPEVTVDKKGQRWLTYVEGAKDKGHIRMVPIDKDLKPAGRAFTVTEGEVFGSEARVVALDDGRLMVTYIRDAAGKTELVTEQLTCEVKK